MRVRGPRDKPDVRAFVAKHRKLLDGIQENVYSRPASVATTVSTRSIGSSLYCPAPAPPSDGTSSGRGHAQRRPVSAGRRFTPRPPSAPRSSVGSSGGGCGRRPVPRFTAQSSRSASTATPRYGQGDNVRAASVLSGGSVLSGSHSSWGGAVMSDRPSTATSGSSRPSTRPASARQSRPSSARPPFASESRLSAEAVPMGEEEVRALCELVGMKAAQRFKTPRECFCNINHSQTGYIERADFRAFLRSCSIAEVIADRVFDSFDTYQTGAVNYNQFAELLGAYMLPGYPQQKDTTTDTARRPRSAQSNPARPSTPVDGLIRHEAELHQLGEVIGAKARQKYRNGYECLRFIDEDRDGLVDREEVSRFIEHFGFMRSVADSAFDLISGMAGQTQATDVVDLDAFMDAFGPFLKPGYQPRGALTHSGSAAFIGNGARPGSAGRPQSARPQSASRVRPASAGVRPSSARAYLQNRDASSEVSESAPSSYFTAPAATAMRPRSAGATPPNFSGVDRGDASGDLRSEALAEWHATLGRETRRNSAAEPATQIAISEHALRKRSARDPQQLEDLYALSVSQGSTASGGTSKTGSSRTSASYDVALRTQVYQPPPPEHFKRKPYSRPRRAQSDRLLAGAAMQRSTSWDGPLVVTAPLVKESVFAHQPKNKPATPMVGTMAFATRPDFYDDYFSVERPMQMEDGNPHRQFGAAGGWLNALSSAGMLAGLAGGGGLMVREAAANIAATTGGSSSRPGQGRRERPKSAGPTMNSRRDDSRFKTSAGVIGQYIANSAGNVLATSGISPYLVTTHNKKQSRVIKGCDGHVTTDVCPETSLTVVGAIRQDAAVDSPWTRWDARQ